MPSFKKMHKTQHASVHVCVGIDAIRNLRCIAKVCSVIFFPPGIFGVSGTTQAMILA